MKIGHLVLGLAFLGCASAAESLTPSELSRSPQSYDGKAVVVRGWLDYGFEKRHLFQRSQPENGPAIDRNVADHACISIEVAERLRATATRLNHRYVIMKGVFRSDLAGDRVFLGLCNSAGIEVDTITPTD